MSRGPDRGKRFRPAPTVGNLVGHFMFGLAPVQHAFADSMAGVAISYPEVLGASDPKPGERVIPAAGEPAIGYGTLTLFVLLGEKNSRCQPFITSTFRHAVQSMQSR